MLVKYPAVTCDLSSRTVEVPVIWVAVFPRPLLLPLALFIPSYTSQWRLKPSQTTYSPPNQILHLPNSSIN